MPGMRQISAHLVRTGRNLPLTGGTGSGGWAAVYCIGSVTGGTGIGGRAAVYCIGSVTGGTGSGGRAAML